MKASRLSDNTYGWIVVSSLNRLYPLPFTFMGYFYFYFLWYSINQLRFPFSIVDQVIYETKAENLNHEGKNHTEVPYPMPHKL